MAFDPITSWQVDEEIMETVIDFIFLGSKSPRTMTAAVKLKDPCSLEEKLWQTRNCIKKQRHHLSQRSI